MLQLKVKMKKDSVDVLVLVYVYITLKIAKYNALMRNWYCRCCNEKTIISNTAFVLKLLHHFMLTNIFMFNNKFSKSVTAKV